MQNYEDLHIDAHLLPLFDFSLNTFARNKIKNILHHPLASKEKILTRQKILRAFMSNYDVLQNYSYTVLYLNEVHEFLINETIEDYSHQKLRYRFFVPKHLKFRLKGKLSQLILLFFRLHSYYFSRISITDFPEDYQKKIRSINSFFSYFNMSYYEQVVREGGLKDKHIIDLSRRLHKAKNECDIQSFFDDLFDFESYHSISLGIKKHNFTFPEIVEEGLSIEKFYHPSLTQPIKNNFQTRKNVIVLNGPNMSGKSTLLKAISICVYLGNLGIAIPSEQARIPIFDYFSFALNKKDDLLGGYSHFMKEIQTVKEVIIAANKSKKCFAVFDEMFSATNPNDAAKISIKTVNGLTKFKRSLFFVSTHLQEIKSELNQTVGSFYMDCDIQNSTPSFTFKMREGWSSIQIGQKIFQQEGLEDLLE